MQNLVEEAKGEIKAEIEALVIEGIKNLKAVHNNNARKLEELEKENSTINALLSNIDYDSIKWARRISGNSNNAGTTIDLEGVFPGYRKITSIHF